MPVQRKNGPAGNRAVFRGGQEGGRGGPASMSFDIGIFCLIARDGNHRIALGQKIIGVGIRTGRGQA